MPGTGSKHGDDDDTEDIGPHAPPHGRHEEPPDGADVSIANLPRVVDPIPFDSTTLDPCLMERYPADRLVRRAVFVPVTADVKNPLDSLPMADNLSALADRLTLHTGQRHTVAHVQNQIRTMNEIVREAGNDISLAFARAVTEQVPAGARIVLWQLVCQDLGYLFLDQVRMRPTGSTIGDLAYTLGLGPREKVTLTQKSWSKRQVSFEDMVEQTVERTVEFASAFATEFGENTEHQQQSQASWNLNATVSGSYGGVSGSLGGGSSASTSSTSTHQTMAKQSQQITQKVTDQAKKVHRVTFKLETETGIENVSQRLFENPNTSHTLMLNFYRVYQQYQVFHERWGARACWAPCVQEPGRDLQIQWKKLEDGWQKYLNDVNTWMPPDMPPAPAGQSLQSQWSEKVRPGWFGYRDDVQTGIDIPQNTVLLTIAFEKDPGMTWGSVDWPSKHLNPGPGATGHQDVWWHIGLKDCNFVEGCPESWGMLRTDYVVSADVAATKTWNDLLRTKRDAELKKRQDEVDAQRAAARQTLQINFDPWSELMRRIVAEKLTPDRYGNCTEVYLWHTVFEWDAASFQLFPNWWSGQPPDDSQSTLTTFLNASWARIYVPIRPGQEQIAFQLIYGSVDAQLQAYIQDLDTYRTQSFGSPGKETVIRIAAWEELMPTDGTFTEAILGQCEAADDDLDADMDAQRDLLTAQATALGKG